MAIIDKPSDYFNTVLYTGNGGTQSITGVGFAPNWVWIKRRDGSAFHVVTDTVRGATKQIYPNDTQSEGTRTQGLQSFDTDGYTLGNEGDTNANSSSMASWNWKANGAGSSNTAGSINSTVSVNTTSGFSIVKYIGNDTSGATVGHGLGVVPKMIIVKRLSGSAQHWQVYHISTGNTKSSQLSGTGTPDTSAAYWNNTSPTNSVFTIGNGSTVNGGGGSDSYIAYCFAEKQGFSKFGKYIGNANADGAFIYTGFSPAFVIIKNIDAGEAWQMFDNKRLSFNQTNGRYSLNPNSNAAEYQGAPLIDFVSNGFKLRSDTNSLNVAQNYIYITFAENPFVASNFNAATAR